MTNLEPLANDLGQLLLTAVTGIEANDGGTVSLSNRTDGWVCGIHFGQEEPDNPDNDMVGGAAYGTGETALEALSAALDDTGWKSPVVPTNAGGGA